MYKLASASDSTLISGRSAAIAANGKNIAIKNVKIFFICRVKIVMFLAVDKRSRRPRYRRLLVFEPKIYDILIQSAQMQ